MAYNQYNSVRDDSQEWPNVLYDFTERYKPILVDWCAQHGSSDGSILFTVVYPPVDTAVIAGGIPADSVPLLRGYLQEHLASFSPMDLHFQGLSWKRDAALYPVWYFPLMLFAFLIRNAFEFRQLRGRLLELGNGGVASEADTLVFMPVVHRRIPWRWRVWIWCAALYFLSAWSISAVAYSARPSIDARLHIEPLGAPDILRREMAHVRTYLREDGSPHPFENPSTFLLLDLIGAVLLGVVLSRKPRLASRSIEA